MHESDEEVIFEGSALHDHLTKCGVDADVVMRALHTDRPYVAPLSVKLHWFHKLQKLVSYRLSRLSPVSLWDVTPKGINKNDMALHYLYRLQQSLRASSCLEADDVDFLDAYMGPLHLAKFKDLGVLTLSTKCWFATLLTVLSYQIFVAVVSKNHDILLTLASFQLITIYPECATYTVLILDNSVTMATFGVLVLLLLKVLLQYVVTREFRADVDKFGHLVQLTDEFQKVISKSISLIQETEIIARGYTIASHGTPVDRIECNTLFSSQRQCPELRRDVFLIARSSMLPIKFATHELIKNPSSRDVLGRQVRFLANIPLEQYGPCVTLGQDPSTLHELFSITDSFSISSIKAMCELCQLQLAEFIKVLILSSICDPFVSNGAVKCLRKISAGVDKPLTILEQKVRELNKSYTMDKANILSDKEPVLKSPLESNSELYSFYRSIRSLSLHMGHALRQVQEMATQVETEVEQGEGGSMNHDGWWSKLEDIQLYMTACGNSYSGRQVVDSADMTSIENVQVETTITDSVDGHHHRETVTAFSGVGAAQRDSGAFGQCDMPDGGVYDDVFEALVDREDTDVRPPCDLSPLDKRERRRQKDNAVSVLHELKAVISSLKTERESLEAKLLVQKYGPIPATRHNKQKSRYIPKPNTNMNRETGSEAALDDNGVITSSVIASNAIASNAIASDAMASNAIVSKAMASNAIVSNVMVSNAIASDAMASNAIVSKAMASNAATSNEDEKMKIENLRCADRKTANDDLSCSNVLGAAPGPDYSDTVTEHETDKLSTSQNTSDYPMTDKPGDDYHGQRKRKEISDISLIPADLQSRPVHTDPNNLCGNRRKNHVDGYTRATQVEPEELRPSPDNVATLLDPQETLKRLNNLVKNVQTRPVPGNKPLVKCSNEERDFSISSDRRVVDSERPNDLYRSDDVHRGNTRPSGEIHNTRVPTVKQCNICASNGKSSTRKGDDAVCCTHECPVKLTGSVDQSKHGSLVPDFTQSKCESSHRNGRFNVPRETQYDPRATKTRGEGRIGGTVQEMEILRESHGVRGTKNVGNVYDVDEMTNTGDRRHRRKRNVCPVTCRIDPLDVPDTCNGDERNEAVHASRIHDPAVRDGHRGGVNAPRDDTMRIEAATRDGGRPGDSRTYRGEKTTDRRGKQTDIDVRNDAATLYRDEPRDAETSGGDECAPWQMERRRALMNRPATFLGCLASEAAAQSARFAVRGEGEMRYESGSDGEGLVQQGVRGRDSYGD